MKRSWFGFVLLIGLLAGSIFSACFMGKVQKPVESALSQAAGQAVAGNWEQAEGLFQEAQRIWKRWEHVRGCFSDHTPVEEIDGSFELLKVFCAARETVSFAGGCRQLARQVAAVGEAHAFTWWNLL